MGCKQNTVVNEGRILLRSSLDKPPHPWGLPGHIERASDTFASYRTCWSRGVGKLSRNGEDVGNRYSSYQLSITSPFIYQVMKYRQMNSFMSQEDFIYSTAIAGALHMACRDVPVVSSMLSS